MKKHLTLLLLAACMALSGTIGAQPVVVTVGDGTTNGYAAPFNNFYKNSYNQMVYSSQSLTAAGMTAGYIGAIAYDCAALGDMTMDEIAIYMGTTPNATIPGTSASDLVPMANLTQVFHATNFAMPSQIGWFQIVLDTPYQYNPATDGNLAIVVCKKATAYASTLKFNYTAVTNAVAYRQNDSDTNYYHFPTGTTTRSNNLPNIQFTVNTSTTFCFPPSGFAVSDVNSNSIDVSWNANDAASYQVTIEEAANQFDPDVASWNTTSATSYSFSNLTPNTTYNVYLRTICSDGYSAPAMIRTTTTAIPATVPYLGTFEDDDTTGWFFDNSTAANIWVIDTAAHYGEYSEHALYISDDNGASNHFAGGSYGHVLAYRPITVEADGSYDVSFDWRCMGYTTSSYNHIRAALVPTSIALPAANAASTALTGISATALPAGYIAIDGGSALNGSANWTTQRTAVNLAAGTYNLLFYWYSYTTASYVMNPPAAIDNISITASTCPGIDSVDWLTTENTANITSYYSGSPSELMLIYKARDAQQPDTAYSYDGSFDLYDIAASSYYDATIYTICGDDTTFAPFNFNFQTDCGAISEFPWDYGFENATWFHYTSGCTTMYWPYCWNAANKGNSTTYNWRQYTSTTNARTGASAAYFYSTTTASAQAGLDEWLKTPTVELTGNEQLSFWVRSLSTTATALYHNRVSVRVSPEDSLDADSLYVNVPLSGGPTCNGGYYTDLTGTTYTQYFADLRGLSGNRRIAFVVDTDSYSFYMDDLRLFTVSNCPDAFNVRVDNYTANSATLAWSDTAVSPNTTSWDIYFGLAGFDADTVSPITVYDTTYLVEDLLPQTDYEYYIVAHCSDGTDANATTRFLFTTACAPFPADSLPYVEDLEAYGSSSTAPINPCWTRQTFGSTTNYPYPSSTAAINGNRGLYFYSYGSTPVYEYAALPMFESDLNVLRIRFNSKRYSTVGSTYFSKIYVGVMSNPDDISTFDTVALIDHTADPASTITAEEIFFDQYDGEGGYIAFLHPALGSSQYNYIYIDDIVVDSIPSCRRSTDLVAENVTINSVDLSWSNTSVDPVDSYTVAYSTDADFNPDTCTTSETVYDTYTTLTGLNAYTRYYWSVKANCNDNAEWAHTSSFMTAYDCGAGNVLSILDTIGNGTSSSSTYPFYASTTNPKGFNYIIFTAQELNEMGIISNNQLNGISLKTGSTGGTIDGISIYMAETDLEGFTTSYSADTMHVADMQLVFSGSKTFTANSWNEILFDSAFSFSGSRNVMFLFRRDSLASAAVTFYYTSTSPNYLVDYGYVNTSGSTSIYRTYSRADMAFNICTTIPSCERPENVTLANLQPTSVDVSWAGTASNYEVAYGEQGIDPDAGEGTHQLISTNSISLTNLDPQTDYDFYVRSRCSNPTDTSNWTFVTHFTTPCLPASLPYFEDFEYYGSGAANPINACWTKGTSSTTAYPYPYSTNAVNGQRSLYFYAYRPSSVTASQIYSYAALPMMSAPVDSLQVTFSMRRYSTTTDYYTSRIVVGLMSDPSDIATFTPVDTIDMKNEPSLAVRGYEVRFEGHTNDGQFIAFYDEVPPLYGSSTYTYSYVYLDDITVDYVPTCPSPVDITVADSTITGTSAVVSWTDRITPVLGYELEYGPAGFELGNGTRIQSTTNPTALSGLMGSTNYEVYVRPICSATDTGAWSFATPFSTICVGITALPFVMDFENEATGTSSQLPLCWTRFNNSTSTYTYYPYVNSSTTYAHSGSKYLYFYGYNSSSYGDNQIASLPEVDTNVIPMNSLELHFWGRGSSSTSTTTTYMSQLLVGVMSDPTNVATFQVVDTVNMNATMTEYVVDYGNYTGNGSYVSLMVVKPATTSTYNYVYLDDITLQQVPDCPPATDIVIDAIDTNMLSLNWTDSVNTTWTLEYGPEGFTPGEGTTINVSSLPVTINGLASGTRYTFIVTPDCFGLVYPTSATFRTAGTYYEVPFVCDFENEANNAKLVFENGTNLNAWNIGTATNNGGSHSLYISNDHGTTNSYNLTASGVSYAYVNLNLPAGDYEYSFDWKAQGESTYDYIQVALVPVYEDIESINGTTVPSGMTASAVPDSWISLHPGVKLNLDSNWTTISDVVTLPQSGIYHLVFTWRNDGGGGAQPPAAIDNVIFARSTCARPVDLTVSNITTHDATLSWIEMGTASQWLYSIDGGAEQLATTTNITFNNLASSTTHRFQVRSLCGAGDTSFAAELRFATLCDLASAIDTFYEDFEFYNGVAYNVEGVYPNCWDVYSNGTDSKYISHVTGSGSYWYPNSGTKCMTMTSGSGATYGDTKIVRLPEFAEPVNTLTVSWYMATESNTNGTFYVGYMVGDDYTTDFVPVKTIPASAATVNTNGGVFDTVAFENAPDSARYIAFKWYYNSTFYSCCIDDIKVSTTMNCFVPTDRNVATTATTATISWSNPGEFNVSYRQESETDWSENQHITGATSVTLSNLVPATTYLYRMQRICENGDTSNYATGSFVTDSMICAVPTGLAVSNIQFDAVTLSWTAEGNDAEYVAHVFSAHHDVYDTVSGATTTVTGLYAAEDYQVAIQRSCGFGYYSEWSDTLSFTTPTCQPVSNVTATAISGTTNVTVAWTAAAGSDTWQIEYGYAGFGQGEGTTITVNTNPYVVTGLEGMMTYDFYVRTSCGEGWTSNWSSVAQVTTDLPGVECGTVEGVSANVDGNYVVINWNAVENAESYELEYGTVGFSFGQGTNVDNLTALAYSITDMPNGNYEVYVRANCGDNNYGPWSQSAAFSVMVGINDADGDMQLSLYPNPATNVTTISLSGFAGKVNVQVVDLNGRVAASEYMECDGNCVKTMNVDNLAQGTYFVRVYGDTVNMVRKLVVR